jgi:hypothetical protein
LESELVEVFVVVFGGVVLGGEPVEQGVHESIGVSEIVDSSRDFLDELVGAVEVASVESVESLLFSFSTGAYDLDLCEEIGLFVSDSLL